VYCPDDVIYEWATATLKDNTTGTTYTLLGKTCDMNNTWVKVTHSGTGRPVAGDEPTAGTVADVGDMGRPVWRPA
jgi:serine protease